MPDNPKLASYLHIMASEGNDRTPWEHVSVSVKHQPRCPTWEEMCFVKELCWEDEECVVQYHPPKSEHINFHPYCLHLYRPLGVVMPRPPRYTVGPDGEYRAGVHIAGGVSQEQFEKELNYVKKMREI